MYIEVLYVEEGKLCFFNAKRKNCRSTVFVFCYFNCLFVFPYLSFYLESKHRICIFVLTGKYMYTEATPQSVGDNAKLQLVVPRSNSSLCLTFFYHMYGSSMGTLNVFNGNTIIFTVSGDQGDYWNKVTRTVNSIDVVNMLPLLLYKLVHTFIFLSL